MVFITLLAFSSSMASAAEPACVTAYRQAHSDYFTQLDGLETQEFGSRVGGYILGAGILACIIKVRSVKLCFGVLGVSLGAAEGFHYTVLRKIERLENAYKIYEVYYEIGRENFAAASVQDFFKSVNAQPSQEWVVAHELEKMMDSGELCDQGAEPVKTWDDMIAALALRKGPLN
ncbi:MAG: hypothetical protein ACXVA9_04600 [Bdellovibrionales bacterium]